jgi:hypothetical protein
VDYNPIEITVFEVRDGLVFEGLMPGHFLLNPKWLRHWLLKSERGELFPYRFSLVRGKNGRAACLNGLVVIEVELFGGLRLW